MNAFFPFNSQKYIIHNFFSEFKFLKVQTKQQTFNDDEFESQQLDEQYKCAANETIFRLERSR